MPARNVKLSEKKEKQDVARTTILVLLVLTILISVISTWYVLDMINSVKEQYASAASVSHGKVSISIAKPEAEGAETITGASATENAVNVKK